MVLEKLRAFAPHPAPESPALMDEQQEDNGQITLERTGAVVTVKLHNPGKLNAISLRMWDALRTTFAALSADLSLRCIVVRGADGNFAAGADIAQFPAQRGNLAEVRRYHLETLANALRGIAECTHPTVALIEGVCIGGGLEIAALCDLRIAGESCRFGAPINKLGFPMAPDELRGLLILAGYATTLELLLEGRIFSAQEAWQKRLLTRLVPDAKVAEEAYATAARIAAAAPLAARLNKRMIRRFTPVPAPLTEEELEEFFVFAESHDHREGVQAFLEKRPPRFRGE